MRLLTHRCLLSGLLLLTSSVASSLCGAEAKPKHPRVDLSNGVVDMALYLPDPVKGYYRGSRFDWSGVIASLRFKGHEYFGEWQNVGDPTVHDRICGPVESFQTDGIDWGYVEAKAGEGFVKIGVGVLEKPKEPRFRWNGTYTLRDPGTWAVKRARDTIEFKHTLKGPRGFGYVYTKTITLTGKPPGFTIEHVLQNTGSAVIETSQYNHNFFVFDGQPSGPDFFLRFPFKLKATRDLKGLLRITDGEELTYAKTLTDENIFTGLEGFGTDEKDHEIVIENRKTKTGVKIIVDRPLYRLNFWTIRTTVCPENYILLRIAPGAREKWTSTYIVYTLD